MSSFDAVLTSGSVGVVGALSLAIPPSAQEAQTARVRFEPQSTDAAIRMGHRRL
jgi:hypothetical protein